jgi:phage replication O-like protein O
MKLDTQLKKDRQIKMKEANFTKINNKLLEYIISSNLTSGEYKILLLVLRKTIGFGKKEDWISYTQFQKITGKDRGSVWRAIEKLVAKKILVRNSFKGKKTLYRINGNCNSWKLVVKDKPVGHAKLVAKSTLVNKNQLVAKMNTTSCKIATQLVAKSQHTKETNTKETNTKEIRKKYKRKKYLHPLEGNIEENYILELSERYRVPVAFIRSKYEDMVLWHEENPRRNRKVNWRATLANWVKRDAIKFLQEERKRGNNYVDARD